MNRSDAEKLGLKVITLKNDAFYSETYRDIHVKYIKSDDRFIYAISTEKCVKFCISASTLEAVQKSARAAIDFYWSVDWEAIEAKKHPQ